MSVAARPTCFVCGPRAFPALAAAPLPRADRPPASAGTQHADGGGHRWRGRPEGGPLRRGPGIAAPDRTQRSHPAGGARRRPATVAHATSPSGPTGGPWRSPGPDGAAARVPARSGGRHTRGRRRHDGDDAETGGGPARLAPGHRGAMNWFSTHNLGELASSALSRAQRSIDRALDIKEEPGRAPGASGARRDRTRNSRHASRVAAATPNANARPSGAPIARRGMTMIEEVRASADDFFSTFLGASSKGGAAGPASGAPEAPRPPAHGSPVRPATRTHSPSASGTSSPVARHGAAEAGAGPSIAGGSSSRPAPQPEQEPQRPAALPHVHDAALQERPSGERAASPNESTAQESRPTAAAAESDATPLAPIPPAAPSVAADVGAAGAVPVAASDRPLVCSDGQLLHILQQRDAYRAELDDLREASTRLRDEIAAEYKATLSERDEQIAQLLAEGEQLSKREVEQGRHLKRLRAQLQELEQDLAQQRESNQQLEKQLEELRADIAARDERERQLQEERLRAIALVELRSRDLAAASEQLRMEQERSAKMEAALSEKSRELADMRKAYESAEGVAKDSAAASRREAQAEWAAIFEKQQSDAARERNELQQQIQTLCSDLERSAQQTARREDALRHEISELRERLRAADERNRELADSITNATGPLLRQIEALRAAHSEQARTWEATELDWAARLEAGTPSLSVMLAAVMVSSVVAVVAVVMILCRCDRLPLRLPIVAILSVATVAIGRGGPRPFQRAVAALCASCGRACTDGMTRSVFSRCVGRKPGAAGQRTRGRAVGPHYRARAAVGARAGGTREASGRTERRAVP